MTPQPIAMNYLLLLLALAGLGAVCSGLRAYARDSFRQQAFAIRDELFDYVSYGTVEYSHPAYWRLRLMMNGVIRFSHRMTFGEAIVPILLTMLRESEPPPTPSYEAWREAVDSLPRVQRDAIEAIHDRFTILLAKHLLVTTPIAWPFLAAVVLVHGARNVLRSVADNASTIEEQGLEGQDGSLLAA